MSNSSSSLSLQEGRGLEGTIRVPSDKSIVHRAVLFASLANGQSIVRANTLGRDNLASIRVMQEMGVSIKGTLPDSIENLIAEEKLQGFSAKCSDEAVLHINGVGLHGLKSPSSALYCGNSGTTARLICGILAGQAFETELCGDSSLSQRPFKRVSEPLSMMGAKFSADTLPLKVKGGKLKGIAYESPRASAQVKSAILLAGLFADSPISVIEPSQSRDHTERMFKAMGVPISEHPTADGRWKVQLTDPIKTLAPLNMKVPCDCSAASFFMVAASIIPDSSVVIEGVGCNPSRTGLLDLLLRMGADIEAINQRDMAGEPICDYVVKSSALKGIEVGARDVVLAIDEIPILCMAAAVAKGETKITGAAELRVKESDRLAVTANLLSSFGVVVEEYDDGMCIKGLESSRPKMPPQSIPWRTSGDHRIAMSGAILELCLFKKTEILDLLAVETSFPRFIECVQNITRA